MSDDAVKKFLERFPPDVRALALKVRAFVRTNVRGVQEQVDVPGRVIGYGFGPRYADLVCVVMPTKAGVNLGFANAVDLPDPDGLLEGTGKRQRHVKVAAEADLKKPALRALLAAAVAAKSRV